MIPSDETAARLTVFAQHRAYLFAVAYRMLGVAEDAEDLLQETWLRFANVRLDDLIDPRAYLVTIVSRLSVDMLRSARRRRETYVGSWLPEPVVTSEALPEELAAQADSASFAFLLLMERLGPLERVVLVLHGVFNYSHEEIGAMIGRSTVASRQLLRRARIKLRDAPRPTPVGPHSTAERLTRHLMEAIASGDVSRVLRLLAPDVALIGDGGGVVRSIRRPLTGAREVARFLVAMTELLAHDARAEPASLNGQPAVALYEGGTLTNALLFDAGGASVTAIYVVRNPRKLARVAAALG